MFVFLSIIKKGTKKLRRYCRDREQTNLSDELVSISTLNFNIEATFFAILCFSAETGKESKNNILLTTQHFKLKKVYNLEKEIQLNSG